MICLNLTKWVIAIKAKPWVFNLEAVERRLNHLLKRNFSKPSLLYSFVYDVLLTLFVITRAVLYWIDHLIVNY